MKRRASSTFDLTLKEQEHVRNALHFLYTKIENWHQLGKLLHFERTTLIHVDKGRRGVSASLAFRIARLAKVTIDDLISGKFPDACLCPRCGYDLERLSS